MLVVQSELSGVGQSLASLRSAGLDADVVARQWIAFGPALSARTQWLERTGRLRRGCREEQIVVIRADKRRAAPNHQQCGSWRADPCWSASRCLTARWIRTGLRTRNTRNAGAIRRGCPVPATPPRSAVPDNVWSQNGSKGKRPYPIQGRCGRRPRRRLGSRFVPAKGSTDRAGAVRRLGTEPCGRAVAGASAAATRAGPARPGKSRCG
jgi:hypothetical protein